jgi:hypothetical protein
MAFPLAALLRSSHEELLQLDTAVQRPATLSPGGDEQKTSPVHHLAVMRSHVHHLAVMRSHVHHLAVMRSPVHHLAVMRSPVHHLAVMNCSTSSGNRPGRPGVQPFHASTAVSSPFVADRLVELRVPPRSDAE